MDDMYDVTVGGFNLAGLLLTFLLIATFMFVVYWMWDCSCRQADECDDRGRYCANHNTILPSQSVVPLYAFELEPGTVILQSADGEIFRILQEYDSVGRTGRGSPPLYESVATTPTSNEYHYVPSYTRAHFQTRPSAPDWQNARGGDQDQTNDAFGDFTPGRL